MSVQVAEDLGLPKWTLGDRLRKAREHAGVSRDQMAVRLGVTPGAISHWERDRQRPKDLVDTVERWSTETGVPAAWLLGLTKMYKRDFGVVTWESDAPEPLTLPFDAREPDLSVV